MTMTPPFTNNDAEWLYASLPQYIQDFDATNGYQLTQWINGITSMLSPVDDFARDDNDGGTVGWSLLFNYYYYYSGTLNGVVCSGLQNLEDVQQALVVLPWLAQCVGTRLPQIPYGVLNESYQGNAFEKAIQPYINSWVNQIVNFNGFQRGSLSAILAEFAQFLNVINLTIGNSAYSTPPITSQTITVVEQVATAASPSSVYRQDPYCLTFMVPAKWIPSGSYSTVLNPSNTYSYYYPSIYALYSNYPNAYALAAAFLALIVPAGLQVTLTTY